MLKKAIFVVFATMLIVFGASISYALQTDGLVSGTDNPALPGGIQASLNPGGVGDSLLYGYYNVRSNINIFNVVNTSSADGVKARIVFRNAKDSREVLDFNICLSKGDVWTAFLLDDGTQARIFAFDTDTVTGVADTFPSAGQQFISGTFVDGTVITPDQTREGYFELVGMSTIPGYDKNSSSTSACVLGTTSSNCIRTAVDCNNWVQSGPSFDVGNVLMGNNNIVSLSNLATYSYNATAVADSSLIAFDVIQGSEMSIAQAMSKGIGRGSLGCPEADYIFTKSDVVSPYDIMSFLGGNTSLILTFPTRFVCHNIPNDALFNCQTQSASITDRCLAYCTNIRPLIWDDKETLKTGGSISPSPGQCLQNEVNVINIGSSSIWNSIVAVSVDTGGFDLGWADVDLVANDPGHYTDYGSDPGPYTYALGIPAVAYTTQSFEGGDASYMVPAQYKTSINLDD